MNGIDDLSKPMPKSNSRNVYEKIIEQTRVKNKYYDYRMKNRGLLEQFYSGSTALPKSVDRFNNQSLNLDSGTKATKIVSKLDAPKIVRKKKKLNSNLDPFLFSSLD